MGIATRLTSNGTYLVNSAGQAGGFDEFTGAPVVDSSLVLWLDAAQTTSYPGSGTTWTDLSGVGNTGTLVNSPTFNSIAGGGSLVFNGTNNYVNCGNSASLNITGSITVDAWVYFTSLTNSGDLSLVSKYSNAGGAANQAWVLWKATADYRTYGPGGAGGPNINEFAFIATSAGNFSGGVIGTGQQVVVNTWYNVVGVYISSSDTMQLYVNGVLMKSAVRTGQTAGVLATGARNVLIGGTVDDNARWVQGNIPSVKIYNRNLTAIEVQKNYNALAPRYGLTTISTATSQIRTTTSTVYAGSFDEVTYSSTTPAIYNLAIYTEQFDNGFWGSQAGLTVTTNSIASPIGDLTADTLIADGTQTGYLSPNAITINSGTTYTFSCYFKAGTQASVLILLYGVYFNSGGSNLAKTFNLSTGVITQPGGTVTPSGFGIVDIGNGWYRCWISQTATASTTNPGQPIRLGAATGNLYAWGYQVEVVPTPSAPKIYQGIAAANTLVPTNFAKREASDGSIYVTGTYDEWTGAPIVDSSLKLWLDAGQTTSYPGTGTTWTDLSGNGNTGTLVNSPTYSSTNGGSIVFNGSTNYVELGDVLDLGTNDMTINAWVSLNTAFSSAGYIVSKARAAGQNYRFGFYVDSTKRIATFFQGNGGADIAPLGNDVLLTNTFYMVTTVISRSSGISMFVNSNIQSLTGSSTISQWNSLDFQSNNPFRIGSYTAADNVSVSVPFNGNVSNVQLYNRALTRDEITTNFNALRGRYGL